RRSHHHIRSPAGTRRDREVMMAQKQPASQLLVNDLDGFIQDKGGRPMSFAERFGQPGEGPDQRPAGVTGGAPEPKAGRGWRPARRWLRIGGAAAAAALVAAAIPAIAAAPTSTVTFFACVTNSTGAIHIVG